MSYWVAGAIVVGAVVQGYSSYQASKESAEGANTAAQLGLQGTRDSLALQRWMYETTRKDFEPWREAGKRGLAGYEGLLQDPESVRRTPGYLFRLEEGLKAIGIPDGGSRYLSGSQLKAATRYGQDYATADYDRALMRYATLAGIGQQATGSTSAAGNQFAANANSAIMQGNQLAAQGYMNAANARASGYIGMGNAANQGVQNGMLWAMMNQNQSASQ